MAAKKQAPKDPTPEEATEILSKAMKHHLSVAMAIVDSLIFTSKNGKRKEEREFATRVLREAHTKVHVAGQLAALQRFTGG